MIRRPPRSPLFPYTTLSRPQGAKVRRAFPADPAAPSALGWIQAGARTLGILARPQEPAARPPLLPAGSWNLAAPAPGALIPDRKSTRLNSSHSQISYAVFCLKKKKKQQRAEAAISYARRADE